MAWNSLINWTAGQLVTHTNLNEQLRDNLAMCLTPNYGVSNYTSGANHTTTSTTFTNVDASNITFNVTSAGGVYLLYFSGQCFGSSGAVQIYFDIAVDGTRLGDATVGLSRGMLTTVASHFTAMAPAVLSAGTRTVTLQWRVSGSTGTLVSTSGISWWYKGI